jgi:hypothetical protein
MDAAVYMYHPSKRGSVSSGNISTFRNMPDFFIDSVNTGDMHVPRGEIQSRKDSVCSKCSKGIVCVTQGCGQTAGLEKRVQRADFLNKAQVANSRFHIPNNSKQLLC